MAPVWHSGSGEKDSQTYEGHQHVAHHVAPPDRQVRLRRSQELGRGPLRGSPAHGDAYQPHSPLRLTQGPRSTGHAPSAATARATPARRTDRSGGDPSFCARRQALLSAEPDRLLHALGRDHGDRDARVVVTRLVVACAGGRCLLGTGRVTGLVTGLGDGHCVAPLVAPFHARRRAPHQEEPKDTPRRDQWTRYVLGPDRSEHAGSWGHLPMARNAQSTPIAAAKVATSTTNEATKPWATSARQYRRTRSRRELVVAHHDGRVPEHRRLTRQRQVDTRVRRRTDLVTRSAVRSQRDHAVRRSRWRGGPAAACRLRPHPAWRRRVGATDPLPRHPEPPTPPTPDQRGAGSR